MEFHSTNKKSKEKSFQEAVLLGLAPDGGLFLPDSWPKFPKKFLNNLSSQSFNQIAELVAKKFINDIPPLKLKKIIGEAFNFPIPLKYLNDQMYVLELFHGPTMAFKDFGARFLSRVMGYYLQSRNQRLNIIVATSGDTGSAVASGFFGVPNIHVFILYPSGKVSPLQEKQLTTYGGNVTALEVKGSFDDCQKLAKQILADPELNQLMPFSSANSINFGRLLPQSFYYIWAVAQLQKLGEDRQPVVVVPSGNMGNIFAGLMAWQMGLPVKKFVAATNSNRVVPDYLRTGKFIATKSKATISNAMDVGNPSNFARMLEMYNYSNRQMGREIAAFSVNDNDTRKTIAEVYRRNNYIIDPHTAVGLTAARRYREAYKDHSPIIILSTAHPAKFKEIVEPVIGKTIALPKQLRLAMRRKKQAIKVSKNYKAIKKVLLNFA